jgi:hypothetical protein
MTVASRSQLPAGATLPIDPRTLVDICHIDRHRYYTALDLTFPERGCVESAIRMIEAGTYPDEGAET